MIIRKSDGAFLYATTDGDYRVSDEALSARCNFVVVDFRQSDHFQKLFAAARAIGYSEVELTMLALEPC